jgi:hypothetical protein
MTVGVLLIKAILPASAGPVLSLAVEIGTGVIVYGVTMLLLERELLVDLWQFAIQAMPGRLRRRFEGPLTRAPEDATR